MVLPLIWAGVAIAGVLSTALAADQIGDAAEQSVDLMNSTSKLALIAVSGYALYTFGPQIAKALK